jgi:hypothetical protein
MSFEFDGEINDRDLLITRLNEYYAHLDKDPKRIPSNAERERADWMIRTLREKFDIFYAKGMEIPKRRYEPFRIDFVSDLTFESVYAAGRLCSTTVSFKCDLSRDLTAGECEEFRQYIAQFGTPYGMDERRLRMRLLTADTNRRMWHEKYLAERQKTEPLEKQVRHLEGTLESTVDARDDLARANANLTTENKAIKSALKKMAKKLAVFASHGLDVEGGMGLDELTPEQRKMINDILKGE